MEFNAPHMGGHSLLAVLRYSDTTRHMIEFEVRSEHCPYGEIGSRMRLFLSDDGYADALERQNRRQIKIRRYAHVMGGNIVYERKKKKRRR